MNPALVAYIALWLTACAFAVGFCVRNRGEFAPFHADYWRFLLMPWKLVSFGIALAGMLWLGPRSGDPTWDWFDASFMSAPTYLGAPWALGVLWRTARHRLALWQAYVAGCLWMFSASWSYDIYILLRDGRYPPSWLANMLVSSILYLLAGLLWNVESLQTRGKLKSHVRRRIHSGQLSQPISGATIKVFLFELQPNEPSANGVIAGWSRLGSPQFQESIWKIPRGMQRP